MAVTPFSPNSPASPATGALRLSPNALRTPDAPAPFADHLKSGAAPPARSSTTDAEAAAGQFQDVIPPFRLQGVTAALFGTGTYQSQPRATEPTTNGTTQTGEAPPAPPNLDSGVLPWARGEWRRIPGNAEQVARIQVDIPEGWNGTAQFTMGPIVGTDAGTSSQVWITDGENNVVDGPVEGQYYAGITTDKLEGGKQYFVCVQYSCTTTMSIGVLHNP